MSLTEQRRDDPSEGKSGASPSAPGTARKSGSLSTQAHSQIAQRAYELAKARGFDPGHEVDDWLEAERQIEAGPPRNTAPDNPFDTVKMYSNE
jgi:hypothetical protein